MLSVTSSTRIFIYTPVADMRKGVHGLSGIVRGELLADPADGSLFVFINRRRDRMKILQFEGGGFWLYYRLLEAGTFEAFRNPQQANCLTIDTTELSMLLSGISLAASTRRRKRYSKPKAEQAA
jgi:transposase